MYENQKNLKGERMDEKNSTTKVRSKKTEKEFLESLTTSATNAAPQGENGIIKVEGAFPQVNRKPVKDKTINGMTRITY